MLGRLCPSCNSSEIEFREADGFSACTNCGTVCDENAISSAIEFAEVGERSTVIGQFVSGDAAKTYSSIRGRSKYSIGRESREATLERARNRITEIASSVKLSGSFVNEAHNLYGMALQKDFLYGRKQDVIIASCLYYVCRKHDSPHLLIDFSDATRTNVYTLGKTFLLFAKEFGLYDGLPMIDPSLFIPRYVEDIEILKPKKSLVSSLAVRIAASMKRDWIQTGRKPDGICAAAIIIAANCFEINVPLSEVSRLFRVGFDTIRKRIDDFKATPASQLSLEQFQQLELDVDDDSAECDPPAFTNNRIKERQQILIELESLDSSSSKSNEKKMKKMYSSINKEILGIDGGDEDEEEDFDMPIIKKETALSRICFKVKGSALGITLIKIEDEDEEKDHNEAVAGDAINVDNMILSTDEVETRKILWNEENIRFPRDVKVKKMIQDDDDKKEEEEEEIVVEPSAVDVDNNDDDVEPQQDAADGDDNDDEGFDMIRSLMGVSDDQTTNKKEKRKRKDKTGQVKKKQKKKGTTKKSTDEKQSDSQHSSKKVNYDLLNKVIGSSKETSKIKRQDQRVSFGQI